MRIYARISAFIDGDAVHREGTVELEHNAVLKTFFRKADKQFGFRKVKYFKQVPRLPVRPTILVNGNRIEMDEAMSYTLSDNDEIIVILPMSGG